MQNEGRGVGHRDFLGFPCQPYSIQVEFMSALYGFLDEGGVSMLESPTGELNFLYVVGLLMDYAGGWQIVELGDAFSDELRGCCAN